MLYYCYLKETLVHYCGPPLALLPSLRPFQKADFGGPRFRGTPTPPFSSSPGDTPLPWELFAPPGGRAALRRCACATGACLRQLVLGNQPSTSIAATLPHHLFPEKELSVRHHKCLRNRRFSHHFKPKQLSLRRSTSSSSFCLPYGGQKRL